MRDQFRKQAIFPRSFSNASERINFPRRLRPVFKTEFNVNCHNILKPQTIYLPFVNWFWHGMGKSGSKQILRTGGMKVSDELDVLS
jgi:hypothetical protein